MNKSPANKSMETNRACTFRSAPSGGSDVPFTLQRTRRRRSLISNVSVTFRNYLESVALLAAIACTSCSDVSHNRAYQDYVTNITSALHDYRSTNAAAAEDGLLRFRRWLLTDKNAGEPWFSKDQNLLGVDGKLFSLYEFEGKTNQADFFFHDAADVYERYLQSKGRPSHILTREELRERTARQETGVSVGWKRQKERSDAVSQ